MQITTLLTDAIHLARETERKVGSTMKKQNKAAAQ